MYFPNDAIEVANGLLNNHYEDKYNFSKTIDLDPAAVKCHEAVKKVYIAFKISHIKGTKSVFDEAFNEFKLVANEITEAVMEGQNIGDVMEGDKVVSIEGSENTCLIIANQMKFLFDYLSVLDNYYHAGGKVWIREMNKVNMIARGCS